MLTLEKENVILWEAESIIKNVVIAEESMLQQIEKCMQEEAFYGDPDFSYY
jgi:hypothetical protein